MRVLPSPSPALQTHICSGPTLGEAKSSKKHLHAKAEPRESPLARERARVQTACGE